MINQQLPVSHQHRPVILSTVEGSIKINSASGRFLIFYIYYLIFYMILKMQNKPKFQTARISIIPSTKRTNKKASRSPQPENKPKQIQIDTTCHSERSRGTCLISHPPIGGFHILPSALCPLPHIKKMTNEPNYQISKMTASHFLTKTSAFCPLPSEIL